MSFKALGVVVAFLLMLFVQTVRAQNIVCSGTVVDDNGEPLMGATVKVVDALGGTVTNAEGHFSLECARGAMLDISYIGYVSQRVRAAAQVLSLR